MAGAVKSCGNGLILGLPVNLVNRLTPPLPLEILSVGWC